MARDKVKHEGRGTGQAEAGLREHNVEGREGCFYSNRLSSSNSVPVAQGDGAMDWAKVNHEGFHTGRNDHDADD